MSITDCACDYMCDFIRILSQFHKLSHTINYVKMKLNTILMIEKYKTKAMTDIPGN